MKKKETSNKLETRLLAAIVACSVLPVCSARAGTVYLADDFENGMYLWETGEGTWRPTDLFYRTPSHSASESPTGTYQPNANSTLTLKIQHGIDLVNSIDPVLTFWHKIAVNYQDYAYVEISADYGFTWEAIEFYTYVSQSTWSRIQIDLANYKMPHIMIRFRLRANGDGLVSDGWDIDDLCIKERDSDTMEFPFFDDFEDGLGKWQLQPGDAWQPMGKSYQSFDYSISESPETGYPHNACSDMIFVRSIDLSSAVKPVLRFWHIIDLDHGDHGYIHASDDGGTTWSELADYTNISQSTWSKVQIDLKKYIESPILIRFRLRDDGFGFFDFSQADGWNIDNVEVSELIWPPYPLVVQIPAADSSRWPAIQSTVVVTDVNGIAVTGLAASNFSVYEDDIPQTPITIGRSTSPIAVSLALDYSSSMGDTAKRDMEAAAIDFVNNMYSDDCAEIVKFANGIQVMQAHTHDTSALVAAIQNATTLSSNKTSLYDAIYQAISDTSEQLGNKAVIAISDGQDTNSNHGAAEVIEYAGSEKTPVFTIGLGTSLDPSDLERIAANTGGVYYSAPTSADLVAVYQAISETLNNEYIVTYDTIACDPNSTGGVEHKLRIVVDKGPEAYGECTKRFRCQPSHGPNIASYSGIE